MSAIQSTKSSRVALRLPPPATEAGPRTDRSDRAESRRRDRRRSRAADDCPTTPEYRPRAGRIASSADLVRCHARTFARPTNAAPHPNECARRAGTSYTRRSSLTSCTRRAGCRARGHSTTPSRDRMRSLFVLASVSALWQKSVRSPRSPRTVREVTRFRWAGIGTCSGPRDDACHARGASCC